MKVESASNRQAYSEKELLTDDGNGLMVTIIESSVGKTVATLSCALAETQQRDTRTVIHNMCDLICILFHIFYRALVPFGIAQRSYQFLFYFTLTQLQ